MRKVDFRSLMIGLLGGVSIFLMMGQNRGNMGDIIVNSIAVRDDGTGGFIKTFNPNGQATTYLGTSGEGNGIIFTFADDKKTAYVGSASIKGGTGGIFKSFNANEVEISYIGATQTGDGMVQIKDKYGNIIFEE